MRTSFIFAMYCLAGGLVPSLAVRRTHDELTTQEKETVDAMRTRINDFEATWPKEKDWRKLPEEVRNAYHGTRKELLFPIVNMFEPRKEKRPRSGSGDLTDPKRPKL
ncbi:hypothetical protein F5148DRAFT_1210213 [Russula earlei]|uniref:Uncharacterized protein n=1 Tax=Russula earlei TaxID=71964 RepID=A0ACC0U565_9AGAM|nr:hypothetical protein F5148DRAFT_1210213 [Russula earlei]